MCYMKFCWPVLLGCKNGNSEKKSREEAGGFSDNKWYQIIFYLRSRRAFCGLAKWSKVYCKFSGLETSKQKSYRALTSCWYANTPPRIYIFSRTRCRPRGLAASQPRQWQRPPRLRKAVGWFGRVVYGILYLLSSDSQRLKLQLIFI